MTSTQEESPWATATDQLLKELNRHGRLLHTDAGDLYFFYSHNHDLIPVKSEPGSRFCRFLLALGYKKSWRAREVGMTFTVNLREEIETIITFAVRYGASEPLKVVLAERPADPVPVRGIIPKKLVLPSRSKRGR